MNCSKCGASVFESPLIRVNPKGEVGVFWCEKCIEKHEPELYKNEVEDGGKLLEDLKEICYQKPNKMVNYIMGLDPYRKGDEGTSLNCYIYEK